MIQFVVFLLLVTAACAACWDGIRPMIFEKCKHKIPYDSYCVKCRVKG